MGRNLVNQILVVEDDPITQTFYKTIISRVYDSPVIFESAESARESLQTTIFPVMILDLILPGLNGVEFCREIRQDIEFADTYIIIITSRDDERALSDVLSAGADDFIPKPVSVKNLESRLQIAWSNHANRVARRKAEELGQFLLNITDASISGMAVSDASGKIIFASKGLSDLTGLSVVKLNELNIQDLNAGNYVPVFDEQFLKAIDTHRIWQTEGLCQTRSGSVSCFISGSLVETKGSDSKYLFQILDISSQKQREERLHYLVTHDPLTELENRSFFISKLQEEISRHREEKNQFAVLQIDIDRFSSINESYDHSVGDDLLRQFAKRLRKSLPHKLNPCRIGPDEFAVIIPTIKENREAVNFCTDIQQNLESPFLVKQKEMNITCSIGIVIYPVNGEDDRELLRNVDLATFKAKDENGNHFSFYTEEMNLRILEKFTLENGLRKAVDNNELKIYLQPIVDKDRNIAREEVLLRWQHPENGLIPPDRFIPIAEESRIIIPMSEWLLKTCCSISKEEQRKLAINISAVQLFSEGFLEFIAELCHESKITAGQIEFEITESVFLHDMRHVNRILYAIKDFGIRLAIDDFGTGYSSFTYLKDLPIDVLKIDKTFVREIGKDPKSEAITKTIVTLANTLNLTVVAEGVETEEQFEFLKAIGCHRFQGYLFQKPQPYKIKSESKTSA